MSWHRQAVLLALLCAICSNKATSQAGVNLAAQPARPATSGPQTTQTPTQASTPPQERSQARAIILARPAPTAEVLKPPIAHEAVATIPGAQRILFAAASPTAEEILVLAQMSNDTYGGTFFVVLLSGDERKRWKR